MYVSIGGAKLLSCMAKFQLTDNSLIPQSAANPVDLQN